MAARAPRSKRDKESSVTHCRWRAPSVDSPYGSRCAAGKAAQASCSVSLRAPAAVSPLGGFALPAHSPSPALGRHLSTGVHKGGSKTPVQMFLTPEPLRKVQSNRTPQSAPSKLETCPSPQLGGACSEIASHGVIMQESEGHMSEGASPKQGADLLACGTVALVQRSRDVISQLKASLRESDATATAALQQAGIAAKPGSPSALSPKSSRLQASLGSALGSVQQEADVLSFRVEGASAIKSAECDDVLGIYEQSVAAAAADATLAVTVEVPRAELRHLLEQVAAANAQAAAKEQLQQRVAELEGALAASTFRVGQLEAEKARHVMWHPIGSVVDQVVSEEEELCCSASCSSQEDEVLARRADSRWMRRDSAMSFGMDVSPEKLKHPAGATNAELGQLQAEVGGVLSGLKAATDKLAAAEARMVQLAKAAPAQQADEVQDELEAAGGWLEETAAALAEAQQGMAALQTEKATLESKVAELGAREARFHTVMQAELAAQEAEREAWMEEVADKLSKASAAPGKPDQEGRAEVQGELSTAVDWLEETAAELASARARVATLEDKNTSLSAELAGLRKKEARIGELEGVMKLADSAMAALQGELEEKAHLFGELVGQAKAGKEGKGTAQGELVAAMGWLEESAAALAARDAGDESWKARAARKLETLVAVKSELKSKNGQVEELLREVERLRAAAAEVKDLRAELAEVQEVSDLALACLEETAAELETTRDRVAALEAEAAAKGAEAARLRSSVAAYVELGAKVTAEAEEAEAARIAEFNAKEAKLTCQLHQARASLSQAGCQIAAKEAEVAELAAKQARMEELASKAEQAAHLEQEYAAREGALKATRDAMARLKSDMAEQTEQMEALSAEVEALRASKADGATQAGEQPPKVEELSNALLWLERTADQLAAANSKIGKLQADKRSLEAVVARQQVHEAVTA